MDLSNFWWQAAAAPGPGPGPVIGNSLRFRGSGTAFPPNVSLGQNNATSGGSTTLWTCSLWVKRGDLGALKMLLSSIYQPNNNEAFSFYFTPDNTLIWGLYNLAAFETTQLFRDPTAWYNFVLVWDSANATAAHRCRLYVNGAEVTTWKTRNDPALNAGNPWCQNGPLPGGSQNAFSHQRAIGTSCWYQSNPYNGYMTEFHCVQGQALDPGTFGEFNADGVWVPKTVVGVTYGVNGFYLPFDDPNDIGADRSGNGNNFTATGFELTDTTSSNYDWMADSPTGNYSTLNPLSKQDTSVRFRAANLEQYSQATPDNNGYGTIYSSGKFYAELTALDTTTAVSPLSAGVARFNGSESTQYEPERLGTYSAGGTTQVSWEPLGGGKTALFTHANYSAGDVVRLAMDPATGEVWYGYQNNWYDSTGTTSANPAGATHTFAAGGNPWTVWQRTSPGAAWAVNYGNRPFAHTPPAGFEPLSTAGLPNVAITNPSDHFTTILDAGANILTAAQAKFPNGLWWIKDRANNNQHQLVDSVRGGNIAYTLPNFGTSQSYVAPAGNSVAWCWNLTNDRSNGFDIVQYTGDGTATRDINHNLGVVPEMVWVAGNPGTTGQTFVVQHIGINDGDKVLALQGSIGAFLPSEGYVSNPSAWTDTTFRTLRGSEPVNFVRNVNDNGVDYTAYLWTSVPGYSAFGSYQGNSSTDGVFCFTGHRPAFVMIKSTTNGLVQWLIKDTATNTYNPADKYLQPSTDGKELVGNNVDIDFLSNGFKIRGSDQQVNTAHTYIWASFAEHPFGGGNVSPSPAR